MLTLLEAGFFSMYETLCEILNAKCFLTLVDADLSFQTLDQHDKADLKQTSKEQPTVILSLITSYCYHSGEFKLGL